MDEVNQRNLSKSVRKNLKIIPGGDFSVMISRTDGSVVWSNFSEQDQELCFQTISALVSGLWQSAKELSKTIGNKTFSHRLNFGDSMNGVYLLPLTLQGKEYVGTLLYKNCMNPAKMQLNFRSFKQSVEDEFFMSSPSEVFRDELTKNKNQLFSNITDEEIDDLFVFTEN